MMISGTIAMGALFAFFCIANGYEWFQRKNSENLLRRRLVLVLCNPFCFSLILLGSIWSLIGMILVLALIILVLRAPKKNEIPAFPVYLYYVSYSFLLCLCITSCYAIRHAGEKGSAELRSVLILTIAGLTAATFELIHSIYTKVKTRINNISASEKNAADTTILHEQTTETDTHDTQLSATSMRWTRYDTVWVVLLTLLYAVLIFWRLGVRDVPQTGIVLPEVPYDQVDQQEAGMVLDLGSTKTLSSLIFYLGDTDQCVMNITYYNEKQNAWITAEAAIEVSNNYDWNEIPLHGIKTRYLHITERSKDASLLEMLIYARDGQKIVPTNEKKYHALFDEQELYPTYNTYETQTIYDEAYYASSEHQFLQNHLMNEETHPPLGKIWMSLGMLLFGVNPFGWRFVVALLGTLMVPVMYLFLKELFTKTRYAVFGSILFCTDFLPFTLSRIGTPDTCIAFLILLQFAMMWHILARVEQREETQRCLKISDLVWLFLCAVLCGISVAVKWTGVFASLGIITAYILYFIRQKRRIRIQALVAGAVCFAVFPVLIYTLAFWPVASSLGYSSAFSAMIGRSLAMWNFHKGIVFSHAYASAWYTWPLDLKPLVDISTVIGETKVSTVATFGNPLLWWCSVPAFFLLLYRALYRKERKAFYLCLAFFSMLFPWVLIRRTVFIYQYYGCALVNIAILTYLACVLDRKHRRLVNAFAIISVVLFTMFYPVLSGLPVRIHTVQTWLEWMENWKFT